MGISIYKIKKWRSMLQGTSIHNVPQGEGTLYACDGIRGYYNDLTEKVIRSDESILVPKSFVDSGEEIYFSIEIFQFGLGAYDLFLKEPSEKMLNKVLACADWAVENQEQCGGWITFAHKAKDAPYSAMAQGEGASLLLRAYRETKKEKYLEAAKKAIRFMLLPIEDGGTTEYTETGVYLYESTFYPLILNGWIFSLWGLWDYCKCCDDPQAKSALEDTLRTLKGHLPKFDRKYWSKYDDRKRISSPFYHCLHIAQLRVMYACFGDDVFKEFAEKWERYQNSKFNKSRAFLSKAIQKIFER